MTLQYILTDVYPQELHLPWRNASNPPEFTGTETGGTAFSVSGTALGVQTLKPPGEPVGSVRFFSGSSNTSSRWSTNSTNWINGIKDADYGVGFWFRMPQLATGTSLTRYKLIALQPAGANSLGFEITISGGDATTPNNLHILVGSENVRQPFGDQIVIGAWYYVALRKINTNIEVFLNGISKGTFGNAGNFGTATANLIFGDSQTGNGSFNISHYHHAPSSVFTNEMIYDVWFEGQFNPQRINFEASSATATATIVNPIVKTDFNQFQGSLIATALLAMPTIVIVNNDNVFITTSIPVDADMLNPLSVIASQNISITTETMTASADMYEHIWFAGIGPTIAPFTFIANAIFQNPPFYGSGEVNVPAQPLTANGLLVSGIPSFQANYRHLVKRNFPSLYINSPENNVSGWLSSITNDGYDNWGEGSSVGNTTVRSFNAPSPLSSIGNGKAIRGTSSATSTSDWFFNNANAFSSSGFINGSESDMTFEFWYYPTKIGLAATESDQFKIMFDFGNVELSFGSQTEEVRNEFNEIVDYNYSSPKIRVNMASNQAAYEHQYVSVDLFEPNAWNHIVFTRKFGSYGGTNNVETKFWINGQLKNSKTGRYVNTSPQLSGINVDTVDSLGQRPFMTEIAAYSLVLSNSEIINHYEFIKFLSPNKNLDSAPLEANATIVQPSILATQSRNFPATPITASANLVYPSWIAATDSVWQSNSMNASAIMIDKFFAGDPDSKIISSPLTAFADLGPNIYRLDTAYFSYVKNNISPHRYVTFDQPNQLDDNGSDNKYALAAPFVFSGTLTSPTIGLNNNSLLSDGLDYTTSGLIVKESEWDDDWGTALGFFHTSYWIKKHESEAENNNLRIIQSVYSQANGSHGILYQQNNYLKMEMFNGTDYFTATSSFAVNVFDYDKHHLVVNFRKTGANHFVEIYVDKMLAININVGTNQFILKTSNTQLPPNTETNNFPRMGVGALVVPIEETQLSAVPQATKMLIDDVYWAQTSITSQQVVSLYEAMPFKIDEIFNADVFLALEAKMTDTVVGVGVGTQAAALLATAENIPNPMIYTDFNNEINAETFIAESEFIEIESVVADNIAHVEITSDVLVASAILAGPIVLISLRGPTMYANAKIVNVTNKFYDPYSLLIVSEGRNLVYSGLQGFGPFGWAVGDVD